MDFQIKVGEEIYEMRDPREGSLWRPERDAECE